MKSGTSGNSAVQILKKRSHFQKTHSGTRRNRIASLGKQSVQVNFVVINIMLLFPTSWDNAVWKERHVATAYVCAECDQQIGDKQESHLCYLRWRVVHQKHKRPKSKVKIQKTVGFDPAKASLEHFVISTTGIKSITSKISQDVHFPCWCVLARFTNPLCAQCIVSG